MAGPLTQVLDLQELMVQHGMLSPRAEHHVLDGAVTDTGEVRIVCTCGRGDYSADEQAAKRKYARHIGAALGVLRERTAR